MSTVEVSSAPAIAELVQSSEECDYKACGFHHRHRVEPGRAVEVGRAFAQAQYTLEMLTFVDRRAVDGVMRLIWMFARRDPVDRHLCHIDLQPGQQAPSIRGLYGTADWHEREAYDMYGVPFEGRRRQRRLLLPDEADYFPLLKDFDAAQHELVPRDMDETLGSEGLHITDDEDRDNYYLNMGPQHPSMHGVLRIRLKMEGEMILEADPVIGYAHRAHEKMAENRDYLQFYPNTSRIDYLSGMIYNLAYCELLEKMLGIEAPERALYIRLIASELNRIQSHLLWLGTYLLDLGGVTPFLYCFDDRENILDILDRVTGARLTYCYGRIGGVTLDVDDEFLKQTVAFSKRLRSRLPDYMGLIEKNVIFRKRTQGVGFLKPDMGWRYGLSGPCLRGSGTAYDVRRAEPYGIYEGCEFDLPTSESGDCFGRFEVRVREMEQSLRIIEQGLAGITEGPIMAAKVPKTIKPPEGEYYYAVESARGHFGTYLVSDGTPIPVRNKPCTPSFISLSTMPEVLPGTMVADTIAIVGSIDIVLPEVDR